MIQGNVNYRLISNRNFKDRLSELIKYDEPLMFDTETDGLYGPIYFAQFYQEHFDDVIIVKQPDVRELASLLSDCWVVCHNASYDISTIQENMGKVSWKPERLEDTLFLSRLRFYKEEKFTLSDCIQYAIHHNPYEDSNLDKKQLQKSYWSSGDHTEQQELYAAFDVYYLLSLWDVVKDMCDDSSYKLDIITLKSNLNFQRNGMPVDRYKLTERFNSNKATIEQINLPINCNSYKQVRPFIGSDDSDDAGLAKLSAEGNEKATAVRRVRKLTKENSFLKKFTTEGNHIYGKFSPSARSGRSTCRDQNLQQLPRSTRDCFGVLEGGNEVLIYSDFSQLELRCVCAIAGDRAMEKLYRDDVDIHTYTAQRLFNTQDPTKEQRRISKTCNFGLLYGAGVDVFSQVLLTTTGITMAYEETQDICRRWRNLWSDIKVWQEKGIRDWNKNRAWQTPLGRRYTAKRITDQLNIQVQGMGSEVAKLANHYMEQYMNEKYPEYWSRWQRNFIHDAYIFVTLNHKELYTDLCYIIANSMQEAWKEMSAACVIPDLPMPVKVDVGYNWGHIEEGNNIVYTHTQ